MGRIPGESKAEENKDISGEVVSFASPEQYPRATVDWKYSLPGYAHPNDRNRYYIGLHSDLLGTKVSDATVTRSQSTFELQRRRRKSGKVASSSSVRYDPKSGSCPCSLQGVIRGADVTPGDEVAIAINGSLEGFTNLLPSSSNGEGRFAFFVLDSVFTAGENSVELFKVDRARGGALQLRSIAALQ